MNHQEKNQTSTHMSYVQPIPVQLDNSPPQPDNSPPQTSIHNLPIITQLANNRIYDNIVLYPGMW